MFMFIRSAALVLMLVPSIGQAQDFDKGVAAYLAKDYATALSEWMPLAEHGDPKAQNNIGEIYRLGLGLSQDYSLALKWFRRASEQGNAKAQNNLGAMYANGFGVSQDEAEALRLYLLAAEHGDLKAQLNLANRYDEGKGVTKDATAAAYWYRTAAEQGYSVAQYFLANRYKNGDGVPQNYVLAHMWYNIAAANGDTLAATFRDSVGIKMSQADRSEAQRRAVICSSSSYKDCDLVKVTPQVDWQEPIGPNLLTAILTEPKEPKTFNDVMSEVFGDSTRELAEGPPMTELEIEGLSSAINKCLNTATLSTDALNTTVEVQFEMSEDAKPDYKSIKMTGFSGGSEAAAQIAFQVARKAIVLCGQKGYGLDPAKYGQWAVLNVAFDQNGMRLR